jgi:hypothetical protein
VDVRGEAPLLRQSPEQLAQRSTLLFVEPRGHAALVLAGKR